MVGPRANADAVRRRKFSDPATNQTPIPGRTISSLVTISTELSWLLFSFLRNVCKFTHVQNVRFPEECTVIYWSKKTQIFYKQLIRFKLPEWEPHRPMATRPVPGITSPELTISEAASRDLPKSVFVLSRHAEVDRKPNITYLWLYFLFFVFPLSTLFICLQSCLSVRTLNCITCEHKFLAKKIKGQCKL